MAKMTELPEMVGEFIDLSKQYLREQTLEPAKKLGRLAGFSFAGAFVLTLAAMFLAVAGARVIIELLPDGSIWSGFGYLIASFALLAVTGIMMWRVTK
ncbi:MAG: phage holin family protein [Acidimicrobiia bacterium]|nr:phage holin family protein [Acidimicrobiia bacterium]